MGKNQLTLMGRSRSGCVKRSTGTHSTDTPILNCSKSIVKFNVKSFKLLNYPCSKSDVVDQIEDVVRREVKERQHGYDQDGRGRGQPRHLDHRQNFRHLSFARSGVKQPTLNPKSINLIA